jgi:hypothetical protein
VTAVAAGVLFLSVVVSSCLRRANNSSEAWALASPTPGGSHG